MRRLNHYTAYYWLYWGAGQLCKLLGLYLPGVPAVGH